LLFGEAGDDRFQIVPDRLPVIPGTTQTLIPTLSDRFDGGPGNDEVVFLGGDLDQLSRPVPDFVAIKYNTILHRYEFTSEVWDTANQQFEVEREVITVANPAPASGRLATNASFQLSANGGPFSTVAILKSATDANNTLADLADDLRSALAAAGFGADRVAVEFPDGQRLRLSIAGTGSVLRADPQHPSSLAQLGFDAVTLGSPVFAQQYAFYQTHSVEKTVIDTRAGDDEVHADPGFTFPNTVGTWGIEPGVSQQGGTLGALEIHGGDGNDRLYGGALDDVIDGGSGSDFIRGGDGSDKITGGEGDDLLIGDRPLAPTDRSATPPDRFEFVTHGGVNARNDSPFFASDPTWNNPQQVNDSVEFARHLAPVVAGQTIDGLTFDLGDTGDWYVLKTPQALKQLGASRAALLTESMIDVHFAADAVDHTFDRTKHLFLFAARDTSPGEALSIEPVELFEGVPKARRSMCPQTTRTRSPSARSVSPTSRR
ncbi:MAG: calcium-binding protein, partial [Methanobacteriota archaeon]